MVLITKELLTTARRLGACSGGVSRYAVGCDLSCVAADDLAVLEPRAPKLAKALAAQALTESGVRIVFGAPALALIGYGSGYGSGDGHGYGYGDGSGYGDGYGSGDGDGSGYGSGYGSGAEA